MPARLQGRLRGPPDLVMIVWGLIFYFLNNLLFSAG
jgi:hypothetical protein